MRKTLTPLKQPLLWLLLVIPVWLAAQEPVSFDFFYGNRDREGQIGVLLQFKDPATGRSVPFNGRNVSFNFNNADSGEISVLIKGLSLKYNNDYGRYKIIITRNCVEFSGNQLQTAFSSPKIIELTKDKKSSFFPFAYDENSRRLNFRVVENGSGILTIRFSLVVEDLLIPGTWRCANDEAIIFQYDISGIKKNQVVNTPKSDQEIEIELWDKLKKEGLKGWCEYLSKYPDGRFRSDAFREIVTEDDKRYDIAKNENKVDAYQAYIKFAQSFPGCPGCGEYISDAEQEIEKLEKATEDLATFAAVRKANTIEAYEDYLRKYPKGLRVKEAERGILVLQPFEVNVTDSAVIYRIIQLGNTLHPRYKDISPDFGLEVVEESRLWEDHRVVVRLGEGNFKLFFEDELGKKTVKSFNNELNASLHASPGDTTLFNLAIDGGNGPYQMEVISNTSAHVVYTEHNISGKNVQINLDTLRARGFSGEFKVRVWDREKVSPFVLRDIIRITEVPTGKSFWKTNLWIFIVVTILLGALAFWYFSRPREHYYVTESDIQ